MNGRLQEFLNLSVTLTGFDRLLLISTAMAEDYLQTLDSILSPPQVDKLLNTFCNLPTEDREAALEKQILNDASLGPIARNIIVLWYTGTWKQLPGEWRENHSEPPLDITHVISTEAYLSGLQWAVVNAHPPGGLAQGFASWSTVPEGYQQ